MSRLSRAQLKEGIIKTVVYADGFDYPLTLNELHLYLISSVPFSESQTALAAAELVVEGLLSQESGFYFLPERRFLTKLRRSRAAISTTKVKQVGWAVKVVGKIPWVRMVALTGAVAVGNSDAQGDVDLVVVTRRGRMWLTRFLVFAFLEVLGLKRNDDKRNPQGRICVNVWCDEENLSVTEEDRDLVVAHEISQAKPLVNKDGVYERFVEANRWLKKYLINWSP